MTGGESDFRGCLRWVNLMHSTRRLTRERAIKGRFNTLSALMLCLCLSAPPPALAADPQPVLTGTVTKVVDADTIDVQLTSGPIRIRLYGIDAPERSQPWGSEATAFLSGKILHQTVELEPFQQDRYERMIAIVHKGDVNVNTELVRLGHAWAFRKYLHRTDIDYCNVEAEARTAKRGLWSLPRDEHIAPWEYRKRKSHESFTDYSTETARQCIADLGQR